MKSVVRILALTIVYATLGSCVSMKKYQELEGKYEELEQENSGLLADLKQYNDENLLLQSELEGLRKKQDETQKEYEKTMAEVVATQKKYDAIKEDYLMLENSSSKSMASNTKRNRELLQRLEERERALAANSKQNQQLAKQLEDQETALNQERSRLEGLLTELNQRSQRINELEGLIAAQDAKMKALKTSISKALTNFEGKGLTVEERNGKVYVSMENKLLFPSGSWAVNTQGKQAVEQLGNVLAQNKDIAVLIEGHTDDDPYGGDDKLNGNWDLSAKRATAIVKILLENSEVEAQNLTAAGRSKFSPVAENNSPENKAKNRRIEVILTPKLDEIAKMLGDI
ncbi:OmpA family protein [Gangjinia marincola]|uniref:OmpA family protein n=1 Tax=Gangjinia marincola TaxID=578463 RepID=A0ABN1MHD5_9FLAO